MLNERAPLFVVTGAPGAGKTTLLPELIRLAAGPVVLDIDELLDEHGAHLGVPIATQEAVAIWPDYNRVPSPTSQQPVPAPSTTTAWSMVALRKAGYASPGSRSGLGIR